MIKTMKQSMKPVYLSVFVFPGIGQFYLQTYIRAILFTLVAGIGFYIMMEATWHLLIGIANDIEQGKQALDINSLTLVITQSLEIYKDPTIMIAKIAFMASWITSSVDAYLTIKRQARSKTIKI